MSSPSKRRDMDVMKLVMSGHKVVLSRDDNPSDFHVKFYAPADSLYSGGIYNVHVTLPAQYPYKSPSIGFSTRIYHPNIDEQSGSVCLDVINQTWSPMYDLVHVFTIFLPQLLLYPNAADPLNPHAASLMHNDKKLYESKVKQHVKTYASKDFTLEEDDDSEDESDDDVVSQSSSSRTCSSSFSAGIKHDTTAAMNIKGAQKHQSSSPNPSTVPNSFAPSSTVCDSDDELALSDCSADDLGDLSDVDDLPQDSNQVAGSMEL